MKRTETPITRKNNVGAGYRDGAYEETHPAFGMIRVAHISGDMPLFGSELDLHMGCVEISITRAHRIVDGSHVWYHGEAQIIAEVRLSHAQYVEMLGRPNTGSGVPCTISYARSGPLENPEMPTPPKTAATAAQEQVRDAGNRLVGRVTAGKDRVAKLLDGKVSNKLRAEILGEFEGVEQDLKSNIPWYVKNLREAAEKVVGDAKVEVESYIGSVASRLGFKSLGELGTEAQRRLEQKD